jgi:Fe-S-cluster containining protein
MERHAPCLDKNCGHCCDPVRVDIKNQGEPPTDKNGRKIFTQREEILIPETSPDAVRLKTFDCVNFDSITKKCLDHENRPDLCRNSTCISDPDGNIDDQHRKVTTEKFIKIFPR